MDIELLKPKLLKILKSKIKKIKLSNSTFTFSKKNVVIKGFKETIYDNIEEVIIKPTWYNFGGLKRTIRKPTNEFRYVLYYFYKYENRVIVPITEEEYNDIIKQVNIYKSEKEVKYLDKLSINKLPPTL